MKLCVCNTFSNLQPDPLRFNYSTFSVSTQRHTRECVLRITTPVMEMAYSCC